MSTAVACFCVHDDNYCLAEALYLFSKIGTSLVFTSRVPRHGQSGDWEAAPAIQLEHDLVGAVTTRVGRTKQSLATVEERLRAFPADTELHFHAASLLTGQRKYPQAREHYMETLAGRDITDRYSSVDIGIPGYKTYHKLGLVCQLLAGYVQPRKTTSRH